MKKYITAVITLLFIMCGSFSVSALSTSSSLTYEDIGNVMRYNMPVSYNSPYSVNDFPEEYIEPITGGLILTEKILHLPGKNGFDLNITAQYNNLEQLNSYSSSSSSYTETCHNYAYYYSYTSSSGSKKYVLVVFKNENEMMEEATWEFYGKMPGNPSHDDYETEYYLYNNLRKANGTVRFEREMSLDFVELTFSSKIRISESIATPRSISVERIWDIGEPVAKNTFRARYLYSDETYEHYEGYTTLRDIDGNVCLMKYGYDKKNSNNRCKNIYMDFFNSKGDYTGEYGAEEDIVDEERNLEYRCAITDSKGRKMYFNKGGDILAVEDRFGNIIRYEESIESHERRITDTLGRVVILRKTETGTDILLDIDGEGEEDEICIARFETEIEKIDESLDPYGYISWDDVYTCTLTKYENEEKESVKKFIYNKRDVVFYYGTRSYKQLIWDYCYNIIQTVHPNGLVTDYDYEDYVNSFNSVKIDEYSIVRRSDKDGIIEYNVYDYEYHVAGEPESRRIRAMDDVKDEYTGSGTVSAKSSIYGNKSYNESYLYKNSKGKCFLIKTNSKYKEGSITSSERSVQTPVDSYHRNKGTSYDDYESDITYFGLSTLIASEIYKKDENKLVKTEYTLSEEGDDFFSGRCIESAAVYESDDGGRNYTELYTESYTYNNDGTLATSVKSGAGGESQSVSYAYQYGIDGSITTTVTIGGVYDADGNAEDNIVTSATADVFGRIISETDANGNVTEYEYDGLGRLITKTFPDGKTAIYSYDTLNRTVIYKSEQGIMEKTEFDAFGNVKTVYKNAGTNQNPIWVKACEYEYDRICRLISEKVYTGYSGNTPTKWIKTEYEYGAFDAVTEKTVTDNEGNELKKETYTYEYTARPGTTSTTSAIVTSPTSLTRHDGINGGSTRQFTAITVNTETRDGITPPVVKRYYDRRGRLCKEIVTDGSDNYISTYIYDAIGNLKETKDARAYRETGVDYSAKYEYNYVNKPTKIYNAQGNFKSIEYDAFGNMISESDCEGNSVDYSYDTLGRRITRSREIDDDTTALTKYFYDGCGNVISQATATGNGERSTQYGYDSCGRIIYSYNGESYSNYCYDYSGYLNTYATGMNGIDPDVNELTPFVTNANVQKFNYDKFGNMTDEWDFRGDTVRTYDIAGNVLTITDPKGNVTSNTYDAMGNITQSSAPGDAISYEYNSFGLCTAVERNGERTEYEYDNFFRVVKETTGDRELAWEYDAGGNVTHFELKEDGETVQSAYYTYDETNNMLTATDGENSVSYTYNDNGLPVEENKGRILTSYEYNSANLIKTVNNTYRRSTDPEDEELYTERQAVSSFEYTYTPDGNVSVMTDTRNNGNAYTTTYTYNNANRLTMALTENSATWIRRWTYAYNLMGDMTEKAELNCMTDSYKATNYTYSNHRLASETTDGNVTTYTYDANGNTLSKSEGGNTTTYTYSPRNELLSVTDGENTLSYSYNATGLRTGKTVNGNATEYVWSGGNIVREEEAGKNVDYFYGINRVARHITGEHYVGTRYNESTEEYKPINGTVEFYNYDGRGNAVQLVSPNFDQAIGMAYGRNAEYMPEANLSGDTQIDFRDMMAYLTNCPVTRSYYYSPFGEQWQEDNGYDTNPFRYSGEYWDKETGSIYLRARYYDPSVGRFVTVDPIKDGENWYAYCSNNPVMFVDPWGLFDYNTVLSYNPNEYNEDVVALQNELAYHGYLSDDDRDGYFGQKTLDAVNAYKNDMGLWNDGEYEGKVGLTTWQHLGLIYRTQEDIDRGVTITLVGHTQYFDVTKWLNDVMESAGNENFWKRFGAVISPATNAARYANFAYMVRPGGVYDLKSKSEWQRAERYIYEGEMIWYDDPGNMLYGYLGKAMGFDDTILRTAAGAVQILTGTSSWDYVSSYFDDPRDQQSIDKGIKKYRSTHSWIWW